MICIFLCVAFLTDAQTDMAKADMLLSKGEYFQASVAYERVLYSCNDPLINYAAIKGKLSCLKQQQKFKEAVSFVASGRTLQLPDTLKCVLLYEEAVCSYLAGSFENTISLSEELENVYPSYFGLGMLQVITILSLNELNRWQDASIYYTAFLQKYALQNNNDTLPDLYKKIPKLKKENTAQWLSTFLPGAGQMYAGKPLEGLVSILLQGAGVYYGITSWQDGYYISAWLVGLGSFGSFHNGSVRRSEILVHQYNRKKIIGFNQEVKKQLISLL